MSEITLFTSGLGIRCLLTGIPLWLTWLSSAAAVRRKSLEPVALGFISRLAVFAGAWMVATQVQSASALMVGVGFGLVASRRPLIRSEQHGCV